MTSKEANIPFKKIFPWDKAFVVLATNIMFAVAFYFVKKYVRLDETIGENLESIILGIIWFVLYFIVMKNRIVKCWRLLNSEGV